MEEEEEVVVVMVVRYRYLYTERKVRAYCCGACVLARSAFTSA